MKKTEAVPYDCIVCDCPYCGKEVIELGGDLRDITAGDFEEENEVDCPHCGKLFLAIINEE